MDPSKDKKASKNGIVDAVTELNKLNQCTYVVIHKTYVYLLVGFRRLYNYFQ